MEHVNQSEANNGCDLNGKENDGNKSNPAVQCVEVGMGTCCQVMTVKDGLQTHS